MNKTSIKQEIIKFCEGKGGFVFGGQIEDYIRDLFGAKASNASRRCRELVGAGILQKSLIQIDGKGSRVVRYKILESTQITPNLGKSPQKQVLDNIFNQWIDMKKNQVEKPFCCEQSEKLNL